LLKKGIPSLIVEGGSNLINSFIFENLWDEARVFSGNKTFIRGVTAPSIQQKEDFSHVFRNNRLKIWINNIS